MTLIKLTEYISPREQPILRQLCFLNSSYPFHTSATQDKSSHLYRL